MRTFGQRLSHLLATQQLTDAVVSHLLTSRTGIDYSPEWVTAVQQDSIVPDPPTQAALATALNVPPNYFTDDTMTALVDSLHALTAALTEHRMHVIGPCRTPTPSTMDLVLEYSQLLNAVA